METNLKPGDIVYYKVAGINHWVGKISHITPTSINYKWTIRKGTQKTGGYDRITDIKRITKINNIQKLFYQLKETR